MRITTFEGFVDKGQIKLIGNVHLPENAKVYVIVPDMKFAEIHSPSLLHPEQAADFKLEIIEEKSDASL
jgi:hypothetical protein